MPLARLLSPHYDDAVFSVGGLAAALVARGWAVELCTVFTRSVPNPQGFALACQTDKGLAPEVDYMALRRAEDDAAAAALGLAVRRLDLPEAPHRGYHAAAALFGTRVAADAVQDELCQALAPLLDPADIVLAPQALGRHVDHRELVAALLALVPAQQVAWWRDLPYAIRAPAELPDEAAVATLPESALPLTEGQLAAKLDACAAYATQLPFQFGGERPMRERLTAFATAEATGLPGWPAAERLRAAPAVQALLAGAAYAT